MGWVREDPKTRKPAPAAQKPQIIQRTFFIALLPLVVLILQSGNMVRLGAWMPVSVEALLVWRARVSSMKQNSYTLGYGFGSIWAGAGHRDPAGG
jgi:hypothetical protein